MALLGSNNPKLTAMLYGEIPQLVEQGKHVVKQTLLQSNGNVLETAKRLHVGRATMYRWFRDFPELQVYLNKIRR